MVPIHVLYGTETYNSEGCAERAGEAIAALGLEVLVADMDDFDHALLPRLHTVLVITSTFGSGEPPANAEALHAWLHSEDPPSLDGLRFSVCGLGDRAYDEFCQCGVEFDAALATLGGVRFADRVDCDADFEPAFERWLTQVTAALPEMAFPEDDEEAFASVSLAASRERAAPQAGTRKNPFPATVLRNENLNAPGSEKETRHVALSLVGSGMRYRPGDSLGLFPRNCPDLVRRLLLALGVDRDAPVTFAGERKTLRYVMVHHKDVNTIDSRLLALAFEGPNGRYFRDLDRDSDARKAYTDTHHILDFAEHAKMRFDAQMVADRLRTLGPRLYSISSSPLMHPGEVHVTVDVLRYELHGRGRKGVASTFLAERAGPEIEVPVYLRQTSDFLLAPDDVPIVMIGPGTGIAPFRAFLEDRAARGVTDGYAWLFFGARRSSTDFLYRDELAHYQESGVLTRLDTAFSRDQGAKVYVQDRMRAHAADLWAWLEAGAVIYVCGDAQRMARDVNHTLVQIVARFGRMTVRDAEGWVRQLAADGRYLRDVY